LSTHVCRWQTKLLLPIFVAWVLLMAESVLPVIIQQPQMQLLQPQMPSAGNMAAASHSILPKCWWRLPSFLRQSTLPAASAGPSQQQRGLKQKAPTMLKPLDELTEEDINILTARDLLLCTKEVGLGAPNQKKAAWRRLLEHIISRTKHSWESQS